MLTALIDITKELTAFDDYLRFGTDEEERPKAKSSRHAYRYTAKQLLQFCKGQPPTPELAKEWIKNLEESNSPRSINRHIWALKAFFRFKGGERLRLRGLTFEMRHPRVLRDEEWAALLATAQKPFHDKWLPEHARQRARLELALLFIYCSGLRVSEGINLKKEDSGKGFLRVMGKGSKERFVPVESAVTDALKDYIASRPDSGPYIFPGRVHGTHLALGTVEGIIKALCRRAGLPDVHAHSLRHTAGYQLRKLGASERDIQDVMGHANIATTHIYTEILHEDLARRLPKRFQNHNQSKAE